MVASTVSNQPGKVVVRVSCVQTVANISHSATIHSGIRDAPVNAISPVSAQSASSRGQTRWPTEIPARSASYAFRSQLHHADGAGIKPGFTVAEVVQPHPAETVIKPELFNLLRA